MHCAGWFSRGPFPPSNLCFLESSRVWSQNIRIGPFDRHTYIYISQCKLGGCGSELKSLRSHFTTHHLTKSHHHHHPEHDCRDVGPLETEVGESNHAAARINILYLCFSHPSEFFFSRLDFPVMRHHQAFWSLALASRSVIIIYIDGGL